MEVEYIASRRPPPTLSKAAGGDTASPPDLHSGRVRTNFKHFSGEGTIPNPEQYDLVILGSGEPGKFLAWALGAQGQRVAVIERKYVGGSCPNIACLPSKNVIHSAKVASYFRRGAEFGTAGNGTVDMAAVRARKREMVAGLVADHLAKCEASGTDLVMGEGGSPPRGRSRSPSATAARVLRGENVVINTGSRAAIDATPRPSRRQTAHAHRGPRTGPGARAPRCPRRRLRFGARVTVVERNPTLIHREDPDVSEAMGQLFRDEGIAVSTGTALGRVTGTSGGAVQLHGTRGGTGVAIGAVTCWSRPGAPRTRAGSGWKLPGSSWTVAVT